MNAPLRSTTAEARAPDGLLSGYGYVHDVYAELNPAHLGLALVNMGFAPPDHDAGAFNYCELGFGQGVTLNALACAYPQAHFFGNDHAPEHLRFASALASASGCRIALTGDAFRAYATRELPPMHYIVAHGIWTWVSPDDWDAIVAFVDRHLAPGGVFYVSYNVLPGWTDFAPVRNLMAQVAATTLAASTDPRTALAQVAVTVRETMTQQSGYFAAHPALAERFERVMRDNPHYLAHEYLTASWTPTYSHEVADTLAAARLQFACSADLRHQLEFLQLPEAARAQLARTASSSLRETLRDYHSNCQFRRDVFVRGVQRLTRVEQRERLLAMRFALRVAAQDIVLQIHGPAGGGALAAALYEPLIRTLADLDAAGEPPPSLGRLLQQPALAAFGFDAVYQALFVLVAKHDAVVLDASPDTALAPSQRLNDWVLQQAERNLGLSMLIDPLARSTLSIGHAEQLLFTGWRNGLGESDLLDRADRLLHATGRSLADDSGAILVDPVARRRHLLTVWQRFARDRLPLLRARRVVGGLDVATPGSG